MKNRLKTKNKKDYKNYKKLKKVKIKKKEENYPPPSQP